MDALSTALTSLRASQVALRVVSENIANANTPGFHRRNVVLHNRQPIHMQGLQIGTGVDVESIDRVRSSVVEASLTRAISAAGDLSARLETLRRTESLLAAGDGSIHDRLQLVFAELQNLASNPNDLSARTLAVERFSQLAVDLRGLNSEFDRMRTELDDEIHSVLGEINRISSDLVDLHKQIRLEESRGGAANSLRDRHDQLVNRLAELVDAQPDEMSNGQLIVRFGGGAAHAGQTTAVLVGDVGQDGRFIVSGPPGDSPLDVNGGRLAGLLIARNEIVAAFDNEVDQFARDLIQAFDAVNATSGGDLSKITGQRRVVSASVPLADAETAFPIAAGSLFVGVTNLSTGERSVTRIDIDPVSQSLEDIAIALGAIDGLSADVNGETGTLTVSATAGRTFDFVGGPANSPDDGGISGTARPSLSGNSIGANDEFTFEVVGSGTVGRTAGLSVEVRDARGDLIATLSIGDDYEPGTPLPVGSGVFVSFSSGTLNDGDTFSSPVAGDPDTSGLLVALGLNSLFSGSSSADIAVNEKFANDPGLFGARSEFASDSPIADMLALRDSQSASQGSRTLEEALIDLTVRAGTETSNVSATADGVALVAAKLETERDSVSGVDPNEELVSMLTFQRQFQTAARMISALDESFSELLSIVR